MKRIVALLIFSAVPLSEVAATPSNSEFTLGVIQSLTGVAAQDGNTVTQAIQLAADDIQSRGTKLTLIIEDDATDPKSAVSAFRKLQAARVDAIIGATWSFTTNALAPLARSEEIVLFNTSTIPQALNYTEGGGFLFNNSIPMEEESRPFLRYLDRAPAKTAVLLQNGTSWGDLQATRYRSVLKDIGVDLIRESKGLQADGNSWDSFMPQLKALSPSIVILLLGRLDTEQVLRKAREPKLSSRFFGTKNTVEAWRFSNDKSIFSDATCFSYPMSQLHRSESFYSRYKERFGEEAPIYSDNSYDSIFILSEAIDRSRMERKPLAQVLRESEFSGIVGRYRYSETNSLGSGTSSLVCFERGNMRVVE